MHAADVIEMLPTVQLDDDVLSAVRLAAREHLPGVVISDEGGAVLGCLSSVDLLRLVLPRYMREDPSLARVFDEEHADHIAEALVDTRIGDVVAEAAAWVPVVRPQATVVEVAELMTRHRSQLVLVKERATTLGVISANGLLKRLAAKVGEP